MLLFRSVTTQTDGRAFQNKICMKKKPNINVYFAISGKLSSVWAMRMKAALGSQPCGAVGALQAGPGKTSSADNFINTINNYFLAMLCKGDKRQVGARSNDACS